MNSNIKYKHIERIIYVKKKASILSLTAIILIFLEFVLFIIFQLFYPRFFLNTFDPVNFHFIDLILFLILFLIVIAITCSGYFFYTEKPIKKIEKYACIDESKTLF